MATQTGAALIVGLIVLTALALLGLSGMRTAQVEERMAGNFRDRGLAFQGAEAALRDAEAYLKAADLPPFDGSVPGLIGRLASPSSAAYWSKYDWTNHSRQADTALAGLKEQPRYVIEALAVLPAATESRKLGPLPKPDLFRVTARSTGGGGTALVLLQTRVVSMHARWAMALDTENGGHSGPHPLDVRGEGGAGPDADSPRGSDAPGDAGAVTASGPASGADSARTPNGAPAGAVGAGHAGDPITTGGVGRRSWRQLR